MSARRNRPVLYEIVRANRARRARTGATGSTPAAPAAPPSGASDGPSTRVSTIRPPVAPTAIDGGGDGGFALVVTLPMLIGGIAGALLLGAVGYYAGYRVGLATEPLPTGDGVLQADGTFAPGLSSLVGEDGPARRRTGSESTRVALPAQPPRDSGGTQGGERVATDRSTPSAESSRDSARAPTRPAEPELELEEGWYVVVQYFSRRRVREEVPYAAQNFLKLRGIETVIWKTRREYRLLGAERFASKAEAERSGLLRDIRALGRQEFVPGTGTYDLALAAALKVASTDDS